MTPTKSPVDWFKVISDLQRAGLSHGQQARELGVSRRTIMNWQQGLTEPSYSFGTKLLNIFNSVIKTT